MIRSKSGKSTSEFEFELTQSLQLPNPGRCYIADIVVPHPWLSIDEQNNHININTFHDDINDEVTDVVVPTVNNYIGNAPADEMKKSSWVQTLTLYIMQVLYTWRLLLRAQNHSKSIQTENYLMVSLQSLHMIKITLIR